MDCRVTSRAPAPALPQPRRMRRIADINLTWRSLHLRMAFQAKIQITLDQQLSVHRTMRVMANRATLPQSLVLEYEWPRLFAMTLRAIFVQPRHSQTAAGFENVTPMRIVALNAI